MAVLRLVLGLWCLLNMVHGNGVMYLRFVEYDNPGGKGDNGNCCDGRWVFCEENGCDHMFSICLDRFGGSDDMQACHYATFMSDKIKNQDHNVFSDDINGLANPMLVRVAGPLPSQLKLKVMVKDKDEGNFWTGSNDYVDTLIGAATLSKAQGASGAALQTLQSRTSLTYRLWYQCDSDWYGVTCAVHCPPPAPGSHYTCDQGTGEKVCQPGWIGSDCSVRVTTPKPTTTTTTPEPTTTTPEPTTTTPVPTTTTQGPTSPNPTDVIWIERENADCDRLAQTGHRYQDGIYFVQVAYFPPFPVYCDMSDEGWTVIQRRVDGELSFNKNWEEYKDGFGEVGALTNYWMGLDNIYRLTNQRTYMLRINMRIGNGEYRSANYENFWIDNEENDYALHVEGFSGNAGDALQYSGLRRGRLHDGMPFSTPDNDHDNWKGGNCANRYETGWWFNDCYWATLNGRFRPQTNGWPYCDQGMCIAWRTIEGYEDYSLLFVEMKILPNPRSRQ